MDDTNTNVGRTTDLQQGLVHQEESMQVCPDTGSHISKLPGELLVEVFLMLQAIQGLGDWHSTNWRNVTYVCRAWRIVALSAPVLWSTPPTHREEYTSLVLERSKSANLRIALERRTSKATINAVLGHIERIQALVIDLDVDTIAYVHDILLSSCDIPWSKLTEFSINFDFWAGRTFTLSPTVIRQLKYLRHLQFWSITFDWTALACPNLTSLSLLFTDLEGMITWQQFFSTLQQMPLLESLTLDLETILKSTHAPSTEIHCIQLPCLQSLTLPNDLDTFSTSYFLLHLILPKLNSLTFSTSWSARDDNDYPAIIQAVSSTLTNGDFGHLDSILVGDKQFHVSRLGQVTGIDVHFPYLYFEDPQHYILFIQQLVEGIAIKVTNNFLGLCQVSLKCPMIDCDGLAMLLGKFSRLKTLIVDHNSICAPLAQALEFGTLGSSSLTPLCRTLENITLILFVAGPQHWNESTAMLDLHKSLLARHKSGFGIKTLWLNRSAMPDDMIKQFEDIGICVEIEERSASPAVRLES
ncbi:hypothetical protein D9619_010106 [Psilocybe cf. subviscida]|uniref:F-box domain-containing protein n=1 Tax=Psilocybe cf. subviscida TaxID=2480587 RepID=A0A8H5BLC7_9AGAR|nr:hypothetical protein D9619_010106 [Psilocybe cf. subviscida]